jgi:hypothetical protein
VCTVTITWSCLFLVIALWDIYLTRYITIAILSLSDSPTLVCFLVFHRLTSKHLVQLVDMVSGVLPSVKLHALNKSVVPAGVIALLGLCNPPRRGCGEPAKPGLLYPLVWTLCCSIVFAGITKQSRLLNK